MAKTKKKKKIAKNMKLEQTELAPITIGIFDSKKSSSFGIFLVLTIFVLMIVFLPQISDMIEAYLHPEIQQPNTPMTPPEPDEPKDDDDDDDKDYSAEFYDFSNTLVINRKDVTLDSFVLDSENNTLGFRVSNASNKEMIVGKLNYYLELYSGDQTLLKRIKLTGESLILGGYSQTLVKDISPEIAGEFKLVVLVKKQKTDYPAFDPRVAEDGSGVIVCSREHEKVTYKFRDNLLREVTSEISYKNDDEDYLKYYQDNKGLSNTYNSKTGIVSTFFEHEEVGYNITTNVNLNEAESLYIFNADTFDITTTPDVVKFEMETQDFTCE